jgi:anti-sigma factor RsiW
MTPVPPEELSALIDRELSPERAAQIERRMAADPELRAAFEALSDLDSRCAAAARTAVFAPNIVRPAANPRHWAAAVGIAAALVGLWVAVRAIDAVVVAFAMQAAALAVLLAGLIRIGRADQPATGEPSI